MVTQIRKFFIVSVFHMKNIKICLIIKVEEPQNNKVSINNPKCYKMKLKE